MAHPSYMEPGIEWRDFGVVLDAMREGLQIIDPEWRYVYVNAAAAAHGRRDKSELVGRTMMECYPGIEATDVFTLMHQCMDEHTAGSMLNVFSYPDGETRIFEIRVAPGAVGIIVLSIDVTENRSLEAQLRHAQKMEAVGRLAGSVAHDFNNLLTVILGSSSMLLDQVRPLDPLHRDIEAIQRAGEQGAALTQQLLAFSRRQVIDPRPTSLNELVLKAEPMLRRLVGEDVELLVRLPNDTSPVLVDPGQMEQVIMNLAVNSRDAMPTGGRLTLETANVDLDETYGSTHFQVKAGRYVMLAVSDTGVGMDAPTQTHIFEPFFTTKAPGKGTGLGLSTVFGIVHQSGGSVWVYSEPGAGTTFKVYLPVTSETPMPVEDEQPAGALSGSETILLVEDQEDVRFVVGAALKRFGYHVLDEANAGEALLCCERYPHAIHLLLTDVVMPKMSGCHLAQRLLKLRPDMKVLYMSGYTDHVVIDHGILEPGIAYLQKPIVPEKLARRVRDILDGK